MAGVSGQGDQPEPQTSRKFTAVLENGKTVVMITMSPMTYTEAGEVMRLKFRQNGKFIK